MCACACPGSSFNKTNTGESDSGVVVFNTLRQTLPPRTCKKSKAVFVFCVSTFTSDDMKRYRLLYSQQ
jgi:hypothetical protein